MAVRWSWRYLFLTLLVFLTGATMLGRCTLHSIRSCIEVREHAVSPDGRFIAVVERDGCGAATDPYLTDIRIQRPRVLGIGPVEHLLYAKGDFPAKLKWERDRRLVIFSETPPERVYSQGRVDWSGLTIIFRFPPPATVPEAPRR